MLSALVSSVAVTMMSPALAGSPAGISKVQMGTGKTDNYEIVNPTTDFMANTPVIYCVWRLEGMKVAANMRGVWIAEDVGKVAPPNYRIDEAAAKSLLANEGYFSLSKPDNGWPVGKYRLEIYMGKDLLKTVRFTVRAK